MHPGLCDRSRQSATLLQHKCVRKLEIAAPLAGLTRISICSATCTRKLALSCITMLHCTHLNQLRNSTSSTLCRGWLTSLRGYDTGAQTADSAGQTVKFHINDLFEPALRTDRNDRRILADASTDWTQHASQPSLHDIQDPICLDTLLEESGSPCSNGTHTITTSTAEINAHDAESTGAIWRCPEVRMSEYPCHDAYVNSVLPSDCRKEFASKYKVKLKSLPTQGSVVAQHGCCAGVASTHHGWAQHHGSPELAPRSDMISAQPHSMSSSSMCDMDCSSDSESERSQLDRPLASHDEAITATVVQSKAPAVPELNLCGISKIPAQERAYQSEKVDCLQSQDITPPWRVPHARHASDPGDGMVRQSMWQSMPTFRDFLSHAPLSESSIYEQLALGSKPKAADKPCAAATVTERKQAESCSKGCQAERDTSTHQYHTEAADELAAQALPAPKPSAAPHGKAAACTGAAAQASPSLSTTQLTFRDLLPPPPGEGAPAAAALPAPTPTSVCSRPASRALSRYPSSAELSTDYGSMPSVAPTPPCGMATAQVPGVGSPSDSTLFDGIAPEQVPGSPCMSRPSPAAPGPIMCQDGSIYEATASGDAAHSGSMSPPSMTPPMQVISERSAKLQRTCSPPSLDAPLLSHHTTSASAAALQGVAAMDIDGSAPDVHMQAGFEQHMQAETAPAYLPPLRFGQLPAIDEDKENGFVEPAATAAALQKCGKQLAARSSSGPLPGLPLQCITAAHVQPATWARQACTGSHHPDGDLQAQPQGPSQDPVAWRARHCGTLTPDGYLTDQLICDAIAASRRCSSNGEALSSGSNSSSRRQSYSRRPLTPEDLEPLSCCVRPASAPPPEDEAGLLSNMPAVWARSHGCFGQDALQPVDTTDWHSLQRQPQWDDAAAVTSDEPECALLLATFSGLRLLTIVTNSAWICQQMQRKVGHVCSNVVRTVCSDGDARCPCRQATASTEPLQQYDAVFSSQSPRVSSCQLARPADTATTEDTEAAADRIAKHAVRAMLGDSCITSSVDLRDSCALRESTASCTSRLRRVCISALATPCLLFSTFVGQLLPL